MDEISFKKGAEGYVAEYTSEGRTMVQIQGVKSGRLSISRFIDTMEPVAMDTVNFTNSVIEINVPAGMKVRLLSDVEVKKSRHWSSRIPQQPVVAEEVKAMCSRKPATLLWEESRPDFQKAERTML